MKSLAGSFQKSERLLIRHMEPTATLVLNETWTLPVGN